MDDLISRQAAIDALDAICDRECEYPKKQRAVMCASCHLGSAFDAIDELPSAERRGRWDNGFCSVCGAEALTEWNDTGGEYAFTTFCPNCGARMEVVTE